MANIKARGPATHRNAFPKKATKPQQPARNDWHTGLTGDEDIPPFLEVKNRTPLTAAQSAQLAAVQTSARVESKPRDTSLPRGVEDDPIAMALLAANASAKSVAQKAHLAELKAAHPPVKSVRGTLLDANHFAKACGCEAKLVRRALRTSKAIPKPAWGWAFAPADEAKVIAAVKAWLKGRAR